MFTEKELLMEKRELGIEQKKNEKRLFSCFRYGD